MNYRHLEIFFSIMTCGTVTEAARQLGVSQPSVTTTLKQAERTLGLTLFHRRGGRLVPTADARALFEEAQRAHDALAAFGMLAGRLRQGLGGQLRIAAIPTLSLQVLPDAIARFATTNGEYSYAVTSANTEDILSRLDSSAGAFHLGFTVGRVEENHVIAETLAETELVAVLPLDATVPASGDLALEYLRDLPYIAPFDGTALAVACNGLFVEHDINPRVMAHIHTHHLAGRLVQRGMGYTLIDSVTVHALQQAESEPGFQVRHLAGRPSLALTSITPSQRDPHPAVQPFIDCVSAAVARVDRELVVTGQP